jgi:hypothetical protein
MDNSEKPLEENSERFGGVDPVQLIIWGILLVAYGIYSTYRTVNLDIENNLIYLLTPNIIMTFFGILMILLGYRREKENVAKS